ncbi:hypothetical protein [Gilvimarinus algae]|uniref:Uncharacterized protein n=1 Tax=Gilvimarinus algae TaxID=3058037 RepID=A0ABT8TD58_9GAMM|nr:hypothetical protein [Gilvimarinus sp. SDUM040014]MDO3381073.1 hypothetical protein [Gilvimarinus sp. SDUM040014]
MWNLLKRYASSLIGFATGRFGAVRWWLLALCTFVVARFAQRWLDGFYARSEFPVPYYIGQTRFSGEVLKGYYRELLEKGTLDVYIQTQLVDYVFMVATFLSFFCLAAAVLHTVHKVYGEGILLRIARVFVWLAPSAALMDALENLISFVMLANPTGFANWLAIPYSSFAVCKFAIFAVTYVWVITAVVLSVVGGAVKAVRRLRPGSSS